MPHEYTFTYDSDRIAELYSCDECIRITVTVHYGIDSNSRGQGYPVNTRIVDLESMDRPDLPLMNLKDSDIDFASELIGAVDRHEVEMFSQAYEREVSRG